MKMKTVAAAAALMMAPAVTFAATPTLSQVLAASGINVSGAVDVSYDVADVDAVTGRAFDTENDGFSLHQVNLLVSKDFGNGVGVTVNPIFGDDANVLSGGTVFGVGPDGVAGTADDTTASNGDDFDLFQGYVSYATGGLTVIGGRFATLAGYEVVNPAGNLNASRGLLFGAQPLVHTGVRASYKVSNALGLTFGVNNGNIGGKTDNNTDATIEAQVALTPTDAVSVYLTAYSGNEDTAAAGGAKQRTDVVDLVTTVNLGMVTLGLNADYITTEGAVSGETITRGAAMYVGVKPCDKMRVALRSEYLETDTNVAATKYNFVRSVTLTTAYSVSPNLDLLAEVRNDKSSENSFAQRKASAGAASDDQSTATIKAILKF